MVNRILIFLVLMGLLNCEKAEEVNSTDIRKDKELIKALNEKSFDTLEIDNQALVLKAYLWRDFMPSPSNENGSSLNAINRLVSIDSTTIPGNIDLIRQYVIHNDSIWVSEYEEEIRSSPDYRIEKISRNGPEWGPEIFVDVISKIHDSDSKEDYYLRLEDVYIERTE